MEQAEVGKITTLIRHQERHMDRNGLEECRPSTGMWDSLGQVTWWAGTIWAEWSIFVQRSTITQ